MKMERIAFVAFGGALAAGILFAGGCQTAPAAAPAQGCAACAETAAADCVEGRWAFTLGAASGWMGVVRNPDGTWSVSVLWGGGSPIRQDSAGFEQGIFTLRQKDRRTQMTVTGDKMKLAVAMLGPDGKVKSRMAAEGWRLPPLPPAPDLAKLRYGAPVNLLADGLGGWRSMGAASRHFGWSFKDGVLSNRIQRKPDGKPTHQDVNLRTVRADFTDFRLSYDVRVLPGCNSGVYLRGIYELQVLDSYGRPVDCHNMAALYGRIAPTAAAEKPANEWQHVDAILCDRHVTVTLNGVKIIDNQPVLGITGGAITADESVPGPIYLQGDHSDADFRNMVLTPILR